MAKGQSEKNDMIVTQILMTNQYSTVKFETPAKAEENKIPAVTVAIQFRDPKQAAKYEHGKTYSVTITEQP